MKRNDLVVNVVKDITDHMLQNTIFTDWHYDEYSYLRKLGEQLLGGTATLPFKDFALLGHGLMDLLKI